MKKKTLIILVSFLVVSVMFNFFLLAKVADYQSIAQKTISSEIYNDATTKNAIKSANKSDKQLIAIRTRETQKMNQIKTQNIKQQFPESTKKATQSLETTFNKLYNYNGNLEVQQKLLNQQKKNNQNYFQNQMNSLKTLNKSAVETVQCFYRFQNNNLLAEAVINVQETKNDKTTTVTHNWIVEMKGKKINKVYQVN